MNIQLITDYWNVSHTLEKKEVSIGKRVETTPLLSTVCPLFLEQLRVPSPDSSVKLTITQWKFIIFIT